jgi:uracil-DNA glycosylase
MPNSLTILFIGSNPSVKAGSTEAFTEDTVSGRILRSWIQGVDGIILFDNIVSQITENNRPLNSDERALARASLLERIIRINPDRLVALGKAAQGELEKLNLKHFQAPHPSGRNRKLNDRAYVQAMVESLKRYCQ